tara:strand:+ start:1417 stop:1635 length:219 start_codon:yes stop_codon:yes gene_type:complete
MGNVCVKKIRIDCDNNNEFDNLSKNYIDLENKHLTLQKDYKKLDEKYKKLENKYKEKCNELYDNFIIIKNCN